MLYFECVYGSRKEFNQYTQYEKSKKILIIDWTQIKYKLKKNDPYDQLPSDAITNVTISSILTTALTSKKPPQKVVYLVQNLEPIVIQNLKTFIDSHTSSWFKLVTFEHKLNQDIHLYFDEIQFL